MLRRPGATVRRVRPAVPERDGVLRQAAQSPPGRSEPFKGRAPFTVCHQFLHFFAGFSSEFIFCLTGGTFGVTLGTTEKSETMTCRLSNNHRSVLPVSGFLGVSGHADVNGRVPPHGRGRSDPLQVTQRACAGRC